MDRVIPFIREAATKNKSFLSVIWFHTPHLPVLAGRKYRDLYKDYSADVQHYYGSITAMDEQIGRLRAELNSLGISENTVIFYTSDNGPEGNMKKGRTQGSTGGLKGRKRSLYEGGIRVPGIMIWPDKIKEANEVNIPVSTSDYYPTIIDILQLEIPDQPVLDGVSILSYLEANIQERENPLGFQSQKQLAWIDNEFKLYSNDSGESFELYNLTNDPGETSDISMNHPELKEKMKDALKEWTQSCKKSDNGQDY
jgi:arylsulfatase A-like enzyme